MSKHIKDLRPMFGLPCSFNQRFHLQHYHPWLMNIDCERKFYELLTIQEQNTLKEQALIPWQTVDDLGEKGAIELAGKLGQFLRIVDPDNDCLKVYRNRKEVGLTGLPLNNPHIKRKEK